MGKLDTGHPGGRFEPAAVVEHGVLGVSSIARAVAGDDVGRIAWLRRIDARPPWDDASLSALEASLSAVRDVHSPAMLGIIDVSRTRSSLLVATEYVEGVPLGTVMARAQKRGRPTAVPTAVRVARALALALATAEEALARAGQQRPLVGVHPEGVLLGTGDDALLADLGLAAFTPVLDDPVVIAYRAPEVLAGEPADARAAVYSIGLVLWELLAGREAFDQRRPGTSSDAVRARALSGSLPRIDSVLASSLPPLLAELAMQCVARDPHGRFASARDLAGALETVSGPPRGELARLVDEQCSDLVALQRKAFYAERESPGSERATLHEMSLPVIPLQRRPIGLAAFTAPESSRREPGADSGSAVDALLDSAPPPSIEVEAPPSEKPPSNRPLPLLVPSQSPAHMAVSGASPRSQADSLDLPPRRRRWGLVAVVVFAFSGALALAAFAGLQVLQKPTPVDVAPVAHAPAPSASVEALGSTPEAGPSGSGSAPRPVVPVAPRTARRDGKDHGGSAAAWDPWDHSADAGPRPSAAPAASAAPQPSSAAPASAAPSPSAAPAGPVADPGF